MMSARQFQTAIESLNGTARKVFEAVPLQTSWNINQILAELHRQGTPQEARMVVGCLNKIVELGLAKEPFKGTFIRAPHRPATTLPTTTSAPCAQQEPPVSQPAKPAPTSFDTLAGIGAKLRELSDQCAKLAKEADDLAIALEREKEKQRETSADVLALQALIKKIGASS